MAINRTTFKNAFRSANVPEWICPTCKTGILKAESKNFKSYESSGSLSNHDHDEWEPYWVNGVFLGILKCNNDNCKESVVVSGKMGVEEEHQYNEHGDSWDLIRYEFLTPTNFNPPIPIFNIDIDIPFEVRVAILNSFKVFWVDAASCANKIRIVVELIMDEKKIPKTFLDKRGKRKGYTLHKRIELFKVKNPEEAELLMAIKWIGNSGSHKNEDLTKDDILDGYEILEHVTNKLYETQSKRIKNLSKEINKRKKPLSKSTKKRTS